MREIKFRAWDKVNKKIVKDIHNWYSFCEMLNSPNLWEIMQYTGLKDKNGKEIYEGDIVEWEETDDEDKLVSVYAPIEWIKSDACFAVQSKYYEIYTINKHIEMYGSIEIIGNIHENPELLNG